MHPLRWFSLTYPASLLFKSLKQLLEVQAKIKTSSNNTYYWSEKRVEKKVYIDIFSHYTEKFYRALETNVVPVVYSAEGIHKVAPPHSYIDVRDFKSPKHLAEYLPYLDKNDTEYMSYFEWRKHFTCNFLHAIENGVNKVFCDFCRYLFEDKRPKRIQNFTKWFSDDAECEEFPKQLYGNTHSF